MNQGTVNEKIVATKHRAILDKNKKPAKGLKRLDTQLLPSSVFKNGDRSHQGALEGLTKLVEGGGKKCNFKKCVQ